MGKNFFKDMSILEQELEDYHAKGVFQKLIEYVESGAFTKSSVTLYLCRNWRLTSQEITRKWNDEHCDVKSSDTWRSQVSTVSRQLYELFPDMYEAFMEGKADSIQKISDTIDLLRDGDESYEDIFIKEVSGLQSNYSGKTYSLEECGKELGILAKLTRKRIFERIDNIDMDKLGYLKKVLGMPLVSNRYRKVNLEKVEILRQLSVLDERDHSGVSNADSKEKEDKKENSYEKFGFSSMSELFGVLKERAELNPKFIREAEIDRKSIRKMGIIIRLFTVDGLRESIADILPEEVYTMLKNLKSN